MTKTDFIQIQWLTLDIILLPDECSQDGWVDVNNLNKNKITEDLEYKKYSEYENNFETMLCRPKTLKGIENNNSWIKLNDGEDFPLFNNKTKYDLGIMNDQRKFIVSKRSVGITSLLRGFYHHGITHFREVNDIHPLY
ncbi:hypothetical protein EV143_12024 [Flavobacterium chryseum]|uniref:hypothetical protein n=1 Tax=Flavobacterium sp. P3160 TaxID=2512113 RepID=UPI00105E0884|nr:hypothetical protein [Flavobacterium sp. P3160]TDO68762.1 hypothetical protein EV143_12024 [Flavobacterium sp. P3160]